MSSARRLAVPGLLVLVGFNGPASAQSDRDLRAAGERAFQKCYACHSVVAGETGLTGPNLRGLLGRPVAGAAAFRYSPAFRAFAARQPVWTSALLDRFLADPQALVPGNAMGFFGLPDSRERTALIAYLAAQRED